MAKSIAFDIGSEFIAEFALMCKNEYCLTTRPITKRNPQANSIIERVHQTLGNVLRTLEYITRTWMKLILLEESWQLQCLS